MIPLILFLCLGVSSALRVDLAEIQDPLEAIGHQIRADYIESLEHITLCEFDDLDTIKLSVVHATPSANLRSLHTVLYAVRDDGARMDPPMFYKEETGNGHIKLTVEYKMNQLLDAYGCVDLPANNDYMGKMCSFSLSYVASDSMLELVEVEYALAVRIPKHSNVEYIISAEKIYKKLCDCVINNEYTLEVEAYVDADCEVPLNGATADSLASRFTFNPTSVLMVYKDSLGGDRTVEMRPIATVTSGRGFAEIIMDVLSVGDYISYIITVVLEGGLRALVDVDLRKLEGLKEGEGIQGESPWFTIEGFENASNKTSAGSSLVESVFALFMIVITNCIYTLCPIVLSRACIAGTHQSIGAVSYTHLRAHETSLHLVCRLLLEKKKKKKKKKNK
eukprot:TRINITY_DN589_c0_g1_i14.p1 TRINITY_DN589_c0_g1~~TRINITY_DN589_c0_g1_i14.p1  ORF type:complete len:392 (-),score=82.04 TRINITY_DN589_c0_g1_i14:10-1185(-)